MSLALAFAGCDLGTGSTDESILWSVQHFGGTIGRPHVDDDIVGVGVAFSNRLVAVERATGALRWVVALDLPHSGIEGGDFAPNLEIHRAGDILVVASGWVYGIDRDDGSVVWSFTPQDDRPGRWVAVADGRVFASGRLIYSIDPLTGDVSDQFDVGEYAFAPIFDAGVLYFAGRLPGQPINGLVPLGEGHAMALDVATGSVIWQHFISDHPTEPWIGGVVNRGVLTDELFVVAGQNARVYGLDRLTGEERWMHEGDSPYNAQVALVDGVVVVGGTNGHVEGLDLQTGALRWVDDSPSSISRMGYTTGAALPTNGRIRAFESAGTSMWGFGGAGWGEPTFSSTPIVRDDILFANSEESGLFAVRFPLGGR